MKLARFTDYSLRMLIFLGLQDTRRVTIKEVAEAYGISRHHLMKVASQLTHKGYLDARRGPGGGLRLSRPASEIIVADVIQDMEDDLNLVECFCDDGQCAITPACELRHVLQRAMSAYINTLAAYSIADLLLQEEALNRALDGSHVAPAILNA